MPDTYVCSGWCCIDCLMLLANGETPPDMDESETAEYLARVAQHTAGLDVTLGMLREDHECASNFTVTDTDGNEFEIFADNTIDARDTAYWRLPPGQDESSIASITPHELQTEPDRGGDCDCTQVTFTWSACDVCGSNLGGTREAVSFFKRGS